MDNGSKNTDKLDINPFGKLKVSQQPSKQKPTSRPTLEKKYRTIIKSTTSNARRGQALVFCHVNFSSMLKRVGSDKDREAIRSVLEDLKFKVHVYDDLTKENVMKTLRKWSRKEHHLNSDCFVVVVMSYGENGFVYAKDDKYRVEVLWENFIGNACPTLIGKPKLFFIQSCRKVSIEVDSIDAHEPKDKVDAGRQKAPYFIPAVADLLVMYSSHDGQRSWKDSEQRSCFIQSLCKELKQHETGCDLLTLLTRVIQRTIYGYEFSESNSELVQVPYLVSMLTKSFYLNKTED